MAWSNKVSWRTWLVIGLVLSLLVWLAIAIPTIIRARQTQILNRVGINLRIIEAAKKQWALENNKLPTDPVSLTDLTAYFKNNTVPLALAGETYAVTTVGALGIVTLARGSTLNGKPGPFTATSF